MSIVHGSAKDIITEQEATEYQWGKGAFAFRNDYSVFDWAHGDYAMPDTIPYKGVAQALISAYFGERAKEAGIPTTYLSLADPETGDLLELPYEMNLTNRINIKIARVIEPQDMEDSQNNIPSYKEFQDDVRCTVIPAEFMFRFGLPKGSSAFRRMQKGLAEPEQFGLDRAPESEDPIWFGIPLMDYSTKFDPRGDIYDMGRAQYKRICGLSESEMRYIDSTTMTIAYMMADAYKKIGLTLWDGKLEFVFDPRLTEERLISVGDVSGALDEVRTLTDDGQQRSKEFGRQYYRKTQPEWVAACDEEKEAGGEGHWQHRVLDKCLEPKKMSPGALDLFSGIYTSTANALWKKNIIHSAPTMKEVDRDYRKFMQSEQL